MASTNIINARSAMWTKYHADWEKFRATWRGGRDFINSYLQQYPRETTTDFDLRKNMSHNPAHAKSVIKTIRNSLSASLSEIKREGDPRYLQAINEDIDRHGNSMFTFLTTTIIPDLLVTGACYVWVDSPPKVADVSKEMDAENNPYIYTYNREDVLSWVRAPNDDRITAVLLREKTPQYDKDTGLETGMVDQYRYAYESKNGIEVYLYDAEGVETKHITILLEVIPFVEILLDQSLLEDIADIQISMLNSRSSMGSGLWKTNFPLFLEPYDYANELKRQARAKSENTIDGREYSEKKNVTVIGAGSSYRYDKESGEPKWIAPPSTTVDVALRVEEMLATEIRILTNIALTSISVKALEQSGVSKEADRVGEEAALSYIATVLESGEREIAWIFKQYLASTDEYLVVYPREFTVQSEDDMIERASKYADMIPEVASATYRKTIQKIVAGILLKGYVSDFATIESEIDAAADLDTDPDVSAKLRSDVAAGILSKGTAGQYLGYPADEQSKILAEVKAEADSIYNNG